MDYSEIQDLRFSGVGTPEMAEAALEMREEGLALKIALGHPHYAGGVTPSPLPRGGAVSRTVREHHLAWGGPSGGFDEGVLTLEPVLGTTFAVVTGATDSVARHFPPYECIVRL